MCDVKTKIMLRQFYLKVIHLKFTAFLHLSKLNGSIMYFIMLIILLCMLMCYRARC